MTVCHAEIWFGLSENQKRGLEALAAHGPPPKCFKPLPHVQDMIGSGLVSPQTYEVTALGRAVLNSKRAVS